MSYALIAHRYAQALFDLAEGENSLYPVYISLQEIGKIIHEREEFRAFIHNPLLSLPERTKIIQSIFENKVPKLLYKFLLFLNAKDRLNVLSEVSESFDQLYLEKNNQMRGALETAFMLEETQKHNVQKKLGEKYKKEISLDSQVKKDLLGGFRLLVAGMLFDSSIKSQLEQFRQKVSL